VRSGGLGFLPLADSTRPRSNHRATKLDYRSHENLVQGFREIGRERDGEDGIRGVKNWQMMDKESKSIKTAALEMLSFILLCAVAFGAYWAVSYVVPVKYRYVMQHLIHPDNVHIDEKASRLRLVHSATRQQVLPLR
jgi:hypothetical protein